METLRWLHVQFNALTLMKSTSLKKQHCFQEFLTESCLLPMRQHRNNAAKLRTRGVAVSSQMQAMGQNGTDHAHRQTHTVGKLQSRQSKIKDRECFTFLGYGGIEECWIYLGSQARISASFPRTWKLNQTLLR